MTTVECGDATAPASSHVAGRRQAAAFQRAEIKACDRATSAADGDDNAFRRPCKARLRARWVHSCGTDTRRAALARRSGREEMVMRKWSGAALAAGAAALLAAGAAHGASIDVGTASGTPGEEVTVAVSLRTMGAAVLGPQNRIEFGGETPVGAKANGDPDCAVNPDIDKSATGFRFLPLGCDPATDCAAVRAVVLAFDNLEAIADGATLYTCRIAIAADAPIGT